MINILTVLKIKPDGTGYNSEWLYKLQNSISRNLTIPHQHICLTDDLSITKCKTIDFSPEINDPEYYWYKINLFRPIEELKGPCLYFDLDMVVSGSLDQLVHSLIESKNTCEIFGTKNPFLNGDPTPKQKFNSSILFWKENPTHLWDRFLTKRVKSWKMITKDALTHGDQAYIANFCDIGFIDDYIPSGTIARLADYQKGKTSVIFFAGKKKPNSYGNHPAIKEHWRLDGWVNNDIR